MVDTPRTREETLQRISRLNVLTRGSLGNIADLESLPPEFLGTFVADQMALLEANIIPERDAGFWESINPWAEEPSTLYTEGARSALFETIDEIQAGTIPGEDHVRGIEALLGETGYQPVEDGTLSDAEIESLGTLEDQMRSNVSLSEIAAANFARISAEEAARQEAEAARQAAEAVAAMEAADREALSAQVSAGLAYAGYTNGNPAVAMRRFINASVHPSDQTTEMARAFDQETGLPTEYARQFILEHTAGLVPQGLQADLESGDPERIALAQNYLNLHGAEIPADAVGYMTALTRDEGNTSLNAPLTVPEGLIRADGTVSMQFLYNNSDSLYLPLDELTAEERAAYDALPTQSEMTASDVVSRETYAALRIIGDDPSGYQALIDAENARRATIALDVELELPVVAVAPETPEIVERVEIARNPAAIVLDDDGFIATEEARIIEEHALETGTGVTDASGYVVFPTQTVAMTGIMDALVHNAGAAGDGEADNQISVRGVMALSLETVVGDASVMISPEYERAIEEKLGLLPGQKIDLSTAAGREQALAAVVSFADLERGIIDDMSAGVRRTLEETMTTADLPDVAAAITAAASLEAPAATEPENDPNQEKLRLHQYFSGPASGMLLSSGDPALTPDLEQAANWTVAPGLQQRLG